MRNITGWHKNRYGMMRAHFAMRQNGDESWGKVWRN